MVLRGYGGSFLLHPDPAGAAHRLRPLLERVMGGEDGGGELAVLVCRYAAEKTESTWRSGQTEFKDTVK